MPLLDSILMELDVEAKTTRRVLDRVPSDKLGWKPHAKSMSLGQLAMHIATLPGGIARMATLDGFDVANFALPPVPDTTAEIVAAYDASVAGAKETLPTMDDATLMSSWTLSKGGQAIMTMPRISLLRTIMCNHLYHHRGQLSVYLRLLDVPVPSIYGPSADENPFG